MKRMRLMRLRLRLRLGLRLRQGGLERPWLCEELIQHVAAMPEPLPPWAKKSPSMPESQVDLLLFF